MEEKKEERTPVQIQTEYQNLCAKAGHIQYTIGVMQSDLSRINSALRDLNTEHAKAKQKEAEAAVPPVAKEEAANENAQG